MVADPIAQGDGALTRGLRRSLRGEVIDRDHPGYDRARQVWNGRIDRRADRDRRRDVRRAARGSRVGDGALRRRPEQRGRAVPRGWAALLDVPRHGRPPRRRHRHVARARRPPFAAGGVYVNVSGLDDEPDDVRTASFGTSRRRLDRIRRTYDPEGLFAAAARRS